MFCTSCPLLSSYVSCTPRLLLQCATFGWRPTSFNTFLLFPQAQRRSMSWLLSRPSPFICWPATAQSCRWTSQSRCPSPCQLRVAWRKTITSLLGDLTHVWVRTVTPAFVKLSVLGPTYIDTFTDTALSKSCNINNLLIITLMFSLNRVYTITNIFL